MTPMKPDWIVVANATRARILQRERGEPMTVVKTFSRPAGRSKVSDLAGDRAGHGSSDHSWGGSAYPPRIDAKRKEHERFATELAAHLERAAEQGTYRSLAVLASSPFLGEVKAELGPAAEKLLTVTHDVDLTAVGPAELEKRILRELAR
ncbi:MAG: host attachment protein [Ramlibacter sp.]|nr:host attachment protein [Ramlibacter sp.]